MFDWIRRKPSINSVSNDQKQEVAEVSESGQPKYAGVAPKDRYDQIEYAFTSGGVKYFRFTSEVNIPFQRAIAAKEILTEELWQIDPKVLTGWVEGLIALLTDDKKKSDKKVIEAGIMAYRLKEQMDLSHSLIRQLKLATVLYFDEQENPLDYQYPYNKVKLEQWTKHNDIPDFFFESARLSLTSLWTRIGAEFSDLFSSGKQAANKPIETYYWQFAIRRFRQRFEDGLTWAAGNLKYYQYLVERPVYEYYAAYNYFVKEQKKERLNNRSRGQ